MGWFLLAGCGLPSFPSLDAPTVPGSYNPADSNIFEFFNASQQNPDTFLGFELYYKFYDPNNTTGYLSDETSLTNGQTGPSQIASLGYKPLYVWPSGYVVGDTIATRQPPLISITDTALKGTQFAVTIPFSVAVSVSGSPPKSDIFPGVFVNGQNTPSVQVARYLPNPESPGNFLLRGFGGGDFRTTDGLSNGGDVPDSVIQSATTGVSVPIVLGLYAIAYGLASLTTPLYSVPVPLGTMQYYVEFTVPTQANP